MTEHYITAIGPIGGESTAVACRCGWFTTGRDSTTILSRLQEHVEKVVEGRRLPSGLREHSERIQEGQR